MDFNRLYQFKPDDSGRKYPCIVILDDESWMREMLRLAIEQKYSDADIIEFADGDEAWNYLSCHRPDLFISDGLHPGAMGLELLRRLADSKSRVPMFCCFRVEVSFLENIALVSGYDSLRVRVLPKPFKIDKFYEGIKELLEPIES